MLVIHSLGLCAIAVCLLTTSNTPICSEKSAISLAAFIPKNVTQLGSNRPEKHSFSLTIDHRSTESNLRGQSNIKQSYPNHNPIRRIRILQEVANQTFDQLKNGSSCDDLSAILHNCNLLPFNSTSFSKFWSVTFLIPLCSRALCVEPEPESTTMTDRAVATASKPPESSASSFFNSNVASNLTTVTQASGLDRVERHLDDAVAELEKLLRERPSGKDELAARLLQSSGQGRKWQSVSLLQAPTTKLSFPQPPIAGTVKMNSTRTSTPVKIRSTKAASTSDVGTDPNATTRTSSRGRQKMTSAPMEKAERGDNAVESKGKSPQPPPARKSEIGSPGDLQVPCLTEVAHADNRDSESNIQRKIREHRTKTTLGYPFTSRGYWLPKQFDPKQVTRKKSTEPWEVGGASDLTPNLPMPGPHDCMACQGGDADLGTGMFTSDGPLLLYHIDSHERVYV